MDKKVQEFLQAKRLAVVGVSRSNTKFGTSIYTELKARGLEVYGVNPNMDQIDGDKCYANLSELSGKVDGIIVCVSPQKASQVVQDAAAAGITKIWLQQGASSNAVTKTAHDLGLDPVTGKCILMYAGEVNSVHNFHRFFAKLFGQY